MGERYSLGRVGILFVTPSREDRQFELALVPVMAVEVSREGRHEESLSDVVWSVAHLDSTSPLEVFHAACGAYCLPSGR